MLLSRFFSRSAFALLALISLSGSSFAQENLKVGVGAMSCTEYVKVVTSTSESSKLIFKSWMQGYLMGMNTAQSALAPELGMKQIPDSDSLLAQMLLYCKARPTVKVIRGTTELFLTLPDIKK
jgi:outer membrane scaffolding protein for murein synthesis (MipA/OmpV family)